MERQRNHETLPDGVICSRGLLVLKQGSIKPCAQSLITSDLTDMAFQLSSPVIFYSGVISILDGVEIMSTFIIRLSGSLISGQMDQTTLSTLWKKTWIKQFTFKCPSTSLNAKKTKGHRNWVVQFPCGWDRESGCWNPGMKWPGSPSSCKELLNGSEIALNKIFISKIRIWPS